MPYTVTGPGGPYREEEEPEELDDGRLRLRSGQTLAPGTWKKFPAPANKPESQGSTPPPTGRPDKTNPADGFGENNTR
jgi:hypothetical protein